MSRNEKIQKLGRAIREYRGARSPYDAVWTRTPVPRARKRVERWLAELGQDVAKSMAAIDGFKRIEEFNAWIRTL